jgi:tRNA pseudouridine38-40 synthase
MNLKIRIRKKDSMSYNYKMIIAYDGARYQGWQINKNAKETIQGKLEYIIGEITGQEISVIGSGRTDKGVHAEGQIANFETEQPQDIDVFLSQINEKLPEDIIVRSLEIADERFNARLTAVDKTYRYTLWKADSVSLPLFERKYVYKLDDKMNIDNMRFGAAKFIGKHDFKGFSSDKTKKSTERTINSIEIVEDENTIVIQLLVKAGFHYDVNLPNVC